MTREPLVRPTGERIIAGVCAGVARHLGVTPLAVRVAFVVLTFFGGAGVLAYAALWAFVPVGTAPAGVARRADRGQSVALLVAALGIALLLAQLNVVGGGRFVVSLLLAGVGVALIWRQVDEGRRPATRLGWWSLVGGGALALAGLIAFLALSGQLGPARNALVAIVVIVVGVALVTAPWWWRLATDLGAERRERIRSQERAEVAAHLHDSVLQTLALIQRHVDSPREVARLARGQERELRSWLYGRQPEAGLRLAATLEAIAAEVEDSYAVSVETVVVGDCAMDARLGALVQATREALLNAARHAAVAEVSLYAEVEPARVAVYVRDRGVGFDPAAVPADRQGVRGSIEGRMRRHGGTATVRSATGAGTEVELTVQRGAA